MYSVVRSGKYVCCGVCHSFAPPPHYCKALFHAGEPPSSLVHRPVRRQLSERRAVRGGRVLVDAVCRRHRVHQDNRREEVTCTTARVSSHNCVSADSPSLIGSEHDDARREAVGVCFCEKANVSRISRVVVK